jgi:excisionase family DNA binding protein
VIVEFDRQTWAHVYAGMRHHIAWCREVALPVPPDVAALLDLADRNRHGPTGVDDHACVLDAAAMAALALTYAAVAQVLNTSKRHVERLVARGDLPTVDVGGAPRVRVADLERYVDELGTRGRGFRDDITTKESA